MTPSVEELAPRSEDEVRAHLAAGKLVEGLQHMSPEYLRGIRRILTVSADTELISAPAYERQPGAFKYPYAFDVRLDSWHELVMANALYDQAGFVLLSDVHRS